MHHLGLLFICLVIEESASTSTDGLDTYVETDFLPIHAFEPKCNSSYQPNITVLQLADINDTCDEFLNIKMCGRDDESIKNNTCLPNTNYTKILVTYTCAENSSKSFELVDDYPLIHNFTMSYNCLNPAIVQLNITRRCPAYDQVWLDCLDSVEMVLPNCSIKCRNTANDSVCFIDLGCLNNITNKRCLMEKYVKASYICMPPVFEITAPFDVNPLPVKCSGGLEIKILDIFVQGEEHNCVSNPTRCPLSKNLNRTIRDGCDGQQRCEENLNLNDSCGEQRDYQYYSVTFECSQPKNSSYLNSKCFSVNEESMILSCNALSDKIRFDCIDLFPEPQKCEFFYNATQLIHQECPTDYGSKKNCNITTLNKYRNEPCLQVMRNLHISYECVSKINVTGTLTGPTPDISKKTTTNGVTGTKDNSTLFTTDIPSIFAASSEDTSTAISTIFISTSSAIYSRGSEASLIVGVGVAILSSFCITAAVIYFARRYKSRRKQCVGRKQRLTSQQSDTDYTGVQMVAFPGTNQTEALQRSYTNDNYQEISNDISQLLSNGESKNLSSNVIGTSMPENSTDRRNINDKTDHSPVPVKNDITHSYSFAQPTVDKDVNGSNYCIAMPTSKDQYEQKEAGTTSNTPLYEDCKDANYDTTKCIRHKEDDNVYDRGIDGTYDTTSHVKRQSNDEEHDTYDHYIGTKTNDNYDVVNRKNKVFVDNTYGTN